MKRAAVGTPGVAQRHAFLPCWPQPAKPGDTTINGTC